MNRLTKATAFAAALGVSCAAGAQDYGQGPHTYYLHRGSDFEQGCWGPCDCALALYPMNGTFVLSLITVGDVTDFYAVSNVQFSVPLYNGQNSGEVITGSGNFSAGQVPYATHQYMSLDLAFSPPSVPGGSPQHFEAFGERSVPPPVIDMVVANNTTGCPGIQMRIVASWFRSDWNGDGAVSMQDLFDFLADYFGGTGDYTGDGRGTVQDVFSFLADWFGGV